MNITAQPEPSGFSGEAALRATATIVAAGTVTAVTNHVSVPDLVAHLPDVVTNGIYVMGVRDVLQNLLNQLHVPALRSDVEVLVTAAAATVLVIIAKRKWRH